LHSFGNVTKASQTNGSIKWRVGVFHLGETYIGAAELSKKGVVLFGGK